MLLSKSSAYFDELNFNTLFESYISDANVWLKAGNDSVALTLVCGASLTQEELYRAAEVFGYDPQIFFFADICFYTTTDPNYVGVVGQDYTLHIEHENETYRATTSILSPVPLDNAYFEYYSSDSTILASAVLTDPSGMGDAYRWETKRISHWEPGVQKDNYFIPPFNSAFDDEFFDGLTFDFGYYKPYNPYDTLYVPSDSVGFSFDENDTVVVKFSKLNYESFRFLREIENQILNEGNPFGAPSNISGNVSNGALGSFDGYSPSFDTITDFQ